MSERIIAACDGASKGNPGPAAWAWVVADAQGRPERWEAGPLGKATNNVAELTALEKLLESTDPAVPIEVRMDSQYAMNAVTKWIAGWKRNGWRTAAGQPVANRDLVTRIDSLLTGRTVDFLYVPAHQVGGDHLNAIADQAAGEAAVTQKAAGTSRGAQEMPIPAPVEATTGPRSRATKKTSAKSHPARPTGTIRAKFAGRCHCGQPYAAKDLIAKSQRGWGHPDCRRPEAETAG
ncbi:ribonuclease HI [Streptomyces sp. NBC_01142]|uniref:ribonuclease H family protein n=1 Tax=Streptomyces sp. NBC_01142 TaxID=2975865 RepID=UPI002258AE8E|nr:ribonuclease H [Streptomyces sp. NBC_01142]MCX4825565.1 ribonuclease HI [Streptomyces sp. NBC_01142]